jgi:hypothetical protein
MLFLSQRFYLHQNSLTNSLLHCGAVDTGKRERLAAEQNVTFLHLASFLDFLLLDILTKEHQHSAQDLDHNVMHHNSLWLHLNCTYSMPDIK